MLSVISYCVFYIAYSITLLLLIDNSALGCASHGLAASHFTGSDDQVWRHQPIFAFHFGCCKYSIFYSFFALTWLFLGAVPYTQDCSASFAPSARILFHSFPGLSHNCSWRWTLRLRLHSASRVECLLQMFAPGADYIYASTQSFLSPHTSMWLFLGRCAFIRCIQV